MSASPDLAFARADAAATLLADRCAVYATETTRAAGGAVKQARAATPTLTGVLCSIQPVAPGGGGQETTGVYEPRSPGQANPLNTTMTAWLLRVPVGTGLKPGQQVTLASTGATFRVLTVDDQGTWRLFDEARCERLGASDA